MTRDAGTGRFSKVTDEHCGLVRKGSGSGMLGTIARAIGEAVLCAARRGKAPPGLYVWTVGGITFVRVR